MKKMIWTLGIVFCIVVLVIGCSKKDNSRKENIEEQKYIKTFGEYCVSKQWIENKEHSTDDMFFYVKEGTEKQRQPDNIAVSIGENKYSKEDDTGLITNQYYIVGEKKYCLVQESNFDESGECDEVAKNLIKSFKWK